MNNPVYNIAREEVRKYLVRLDKVLDAASNEPSIKEAMDKNDFYNGLKFGDDLGDRNGILSYLYHTQVDLLHKQIEQEVEINGLKSDVKALVAVINDIHKHLEQQMPGPAYNQTKRFDLQNTLSKYGVYY